MNYSALAIGIFNLLLPWYSFLISIILSTVYTLPFKLLPTPPSVLKVEDPLRRDGWNKKSALNPGEGSPPRKGPFCK